MSVRAQARSTILDAAGWSVYLGASWTWCVGMFLPLLLIRDYGPWAWLVFAVPNVVGAVLMGWALPDGASERFVARWGPLCRAFSVVTIGFHVYFLTGTMHRVIPTAFWVLALVLVVLFMQDAVRLAALVATVVSVVALARLLPGLEWTGMPAAPEGDTGLLPLGGLVIAYCFGFVACPWLDLTFHRARRSLPAPLARLAFVTGFGVVFLAMILLSFLYSDLFSRPTSWLRTWLPLHLLLQACFTVLAHLRELLPASGEGRRIRRSDAILAVAAVLLAAATVLLGRWSPLGDEQWETGYWLILGFYGMFVPAALWMLAICGDSRRRSWKTWALLAGILVAAFPLYWTGFIEARPAWLGPGAAILLGGGMLVRALEPERSDD